MTPALTHLAVLEIAIPLIAAPFCALLGHSRLTWLLALGISWATLAGAILLLTEVLTNGPISYHVGGWAPPWGIEYRVDVVNAFVLVIISAIGSIVLPYAFASVEREIPERQRGLFYTSYLLCLTGLLGVTITGDAFNVFVFLEISSLSTYVLVAAGARHDRRALRAAYDYLILGTVGATFFVIGVGLLYMVTGTLNLADLAVRVAALGPDNRVVHAAFGFIVAGMGLKLAMFPAHLWLPNAYAFAPSVVTAFLAATATKAAVYVLLRFVFGVFDPTAGFIGSAMTWLLLPMGLVGMIAASVAAIYQTNVKRLLAWSSVAQVGYMVLGISFASVTGLTATILHLFNHALMKGALFLALGAVFYRIGAVDMTAMRGLGRTMPWTMAGIVLGGLSLIGVPLTVGFISKWYLILASIEAGTWPVAALIVFASLLAVIYVWRVIEAAYLQPPPDDATQAEAPLSMLVPMWVLVLANVYFGIDGVRTAEIAGIAAALVGGDG